MVTVTGLVEPGFEVVVDADIADFDQRDGVGALGAQIPEW